MAAKQEASFRNHIDQRKVAIVCSARSGSTKALGTTNLLLRSASEALQRPTKLASSSGTTTPGTRNLFGAGLNGSQSPPPSTPQRENLPGSVSPQENFHSLVVPKSGQAYPEFNITVDLVREQHIEAARASVRDPNILGELEEEIERDCDWLRSFLFAAQVGFQGYIDIR